MTDSRQLEQIHKTSIRILAELGIRTEHAGMCERLAGLGCRVANGRVYISPELTQRAISSTPNSFRIYGRDDYTGVLVDRNGPPLYTNTGILPNIYDFESGIVRRSTRTDVETTTRVMDALSEVDVVYVSLVDATEVAAHMVTVTDFAATLANTTKPLVGPGIIDVSEAKAIIAMALALRKGDPQDLKLRPVCAPFVGAITPLLFTTETVDALVELVQAGFPLMALTNPVAGTTSPYTIASSVALGHAEVLAIVVMAYATCPGTPVISFNTPTIADMRTMASTTGGPETGLMRSLAVELARSLGLPSFGHGHTSSARLDIQASDEKSINALLLAQAGPSLLGGLGGLANVTLTSYETMVMDNERFGAFRRILQGVILDEDHLAFEVIADVVQGQSIITHDHTVKNLRAGEIWKPKLARRQGLLNGQPEAITTLERARAEAKRIMDQHIVEPLSQAIQAELDAILRERDLQFPPD